MNEKSNNKYIKAGFGYTFSNYLLKGLSFLTLPLFLRLLTPAQYGDLSTYTACEAMLSAVLGLALHASLKNAKYRYPDPQEYRRYLAACIMMGILFISVLVALVNLLYPVLRSFLGVDHFVLNLLLLNSYASAVITFYNAYLALEYRYKSFLAVALTNAVGSIVLSLALMLTVLDQNRYLGRLLGLAVPAIVIAVVIAGFFLRQGGICFAKEKWLFGLRYSFPLIFHGVSQTALNQADRVMIRRMTGAENAGIYSFGCTFYTLVFVTTSSLMQVWSPWFYERMAKQDHGQIRKRGQELAFGVTLFVACVLLGVPELISLLGTRDYAASVQYVMPLIIGGFFAFLYHFPAQVEYYYGKTRYIAAGTCASAVLNIIFNDIGIRLFGSVAAAYVTMMIHLVCFLFHYFLSVKLHGTQIFDLKRLLLYSAALMAAGVAAWTLQPYWAVRWLLILAAGLFLLRWLLGRFAKPECKQNEHAN